MVLGECLYAVLSDGFSPNQRIDVWEQRFLLEQHVLSYLAGILVKQFHHQHPQPVPLVYRLCKFTAYERQLKIKVIHMAGFQIMQQRWNGQLLVIVKIGISVDGQIYHCKKCISIYSVVLAYLLHGLVAESKIYPETSQRLQQIVIVLYERYHLVACLIYLLLLHILSMPAYTLT